MKNLFYIFFLIVICSCSKDKDETNCVPAPNNIDINIVDKITGENVFTSGMFKQNQVQILTNPANQFPVNFTQNTGLNTLTIVPIKAEGFINFSIILNNQITIQLKAKIIVNNGCGTNYYFESITSLGNENEIVQNGKNVTIKI